MPDLITFTCPSCGGEVRVTSDVERFSCDHCESEYGIQRSDDTTSLVLQAEGLVKVHTGVYKKRLSKYSTSQNVNEETGNELINLLRTSVDEWNSWRSTHPTATVDLSYAKLHDINLDEYDLSNARLYKADLQGASLWKANLTAADITQANLQGSNLRQTILKGAVAVRANISRSVCWKANLQDANLFLADFWGTDLSEANLRNATLIEARLHGAILIRADLQNANLSKAMVYGSSIWDAILDGATQRDLVITPDAGRQKWHGYDRMKINGPVMTVDDLEVAQFIYLLINNAKVRRVIDTITSKLVLLLGRFTPERKAVLDSLREALRQHDLIPVLFDFEKPSDRDITETVGLLGHLARMVIADLTDPRSVPQELQRLIPSLPSVPIQPIIQEAQSPYSMFPDFGAYLSVLPPLPYRDANHLCEILQSKILEPATEKSKEIALRRANYSATFSR
jgi:uncharacterized protein YjbI with pentapeptide repeats